MYGCCMQWVRLRSGISSIPKSRNWKQFWWAQIYLDCRGMGRYMKEDKLKRCCLVQLILYVVGTHRYAVMWTGDDSGSFEYLRWQLTTFVGSGFSVVLHTILMYSTLYFEPLGNGTCIRGYWRHFWGQSRNLYKLNKVKYLLVWCLLLDVRDLQFKCLMTTLMTMSGWAENPDKQPWTYGEPYTSINRMYLTLKVNLTLWLCDCCQCLVKGKINPLHVHVLAHCSWYWSTSNSCFGDSLCYYLFLYKRFKISRAERLFSMQALEFPEDTSTYKNSTGTAYQFMSGEWFLVAPVYTNTTVRDGIYLPAGLWFDYWSGTQYEGWVLPIII